MNSGIIQALNDSREEVVTSAVGISEEQAKVSPGEGRWSVLQCVEHIVTSEGRFMGWLQHPDDGPAPAEDKAKEAMLAERLPSRTTRVQAPEASQPKDRFTTLAEALNAFTSTRERSIQFAQEKGPGLYSIATKHPFFGPVNGTELMVMIAGHSRRHAAQIREIKEQLAQLR
jgi:uncharacterized damage-inducible protein DinB